MSLQNDIQLRFPNYRTLASAAFNREHNLWERPMYQTNAVFQSVKEEYGMNEDRTTTRQQIINLFSEKKYYEGYLCALVWGNIGTFQDGRQHFEDAFSITKQDAENKIRQITKLISNGRLGNAFDSMLPRGDNHFPGLGVSFFTKILYFIGASIGKNDPLIFDSNSLRILNRLYIDSGIRIQARQSKRHYLYFCSQMGLISNSLSLPNPGYLEAFLFNDGRVLL